ncbi:MAG: DUF3793 family protein [Butyricicoccus sp.]
MQKYLLERELAHHCAPALCGLKSANLVCFAKREFPELHMLLAEYQKEFARFGICLEMVCSCDRRDLVLVYQPGLLARQLSQKKVRELLRQDGYPTSSMREQIEHLKFRLAEQQDFPHEIGLFLGYPVSDVLAFQNSRGADCKLCGYWKVYGDVEAARRCFARFDACRAAMTKSLHAGKTIIQALEAYRIHTA